MGLNRLLHQHQVSLMRAAATTGPARADHARSAHAYAHRIAALVAPDRGDARPLVPLA